VVIPAHDEAGNLPVLVAEVERALEGLLDYEIVVVDDASGDDTPAVLAKLAATRPRLVWRRHARQAGQSTALRNAARLARGEWLATLDGDGQNDPADLPELWQAHLDQPALKLFQGWRVKRRDSGIKRLSSRIANGVRARLLRDATPDSGCGIRLIERQVLLALPYFDHMHRFLPALTRQAGWPSASVPVNHRPRQAGRSHYGLGNRLWVGLVDLIGVAWLGRRARPTPFEEV
ncbi:MAG TPA: glycosyltransferase family 2 protein, partial [Xanthomonadaceae bacterium]|nr:glycosyltransferase family 2 protein [Xanthomonadaceae bacterium]